MTALDACHAARAAYDRVSMQQQLFEPSAAGSLGGDSDALRAQEMESRVTAAELISPPVGAVTLLSLGAGHDTGGEQATGQGTNHVRMRGVPALAPQRHAGTSLAGTPFAKNVNSPSVQSPGVDGALRGSQEKDR